MHLIFWGILTIIYLVRVAISVAPLPEEHIACTLTRYGSTLKGPGRHGGVPGGGGVGGTHTRGAPPGGAPKEER